MGSALGCTEARITVFEAPIATSAMAIPGAHPQAGVLAAVKGTPCGRPQAGPP